MTRLRVTFFGLLAVAIVALVALMSALGRPASPVVGATVAISGITLVAAMALLTRMLLVTDLARRPNRINSQDGHDQQG